jgi:Bifunctional DNA primase/polymerase, N-terminal
MAWTPFQERLPTVAELHSWWRRWPHANVGVATGMASQLRVLDVDHRSDGLTTLVELDAYGYTMPNNNPLPGTGGRGLHHFFRLDAPLPSCTPWQGIEVKADKRLVVLPPSRHASGRCYAWLRHAEHPLPPLPTWVRLTVAAWLRPESPLPASPSMAPGSLTGDDLLALFERAGLYLRPDRPRGRHHVRCPWAGEHSNGDPGAMLLEPGASLAPGWGFVCLHAHCSGRGIGAVLDYFRVPRRRFA